MRLFRRLALAGWALGSCLGAATASPAPTPLPGPVRPPAAARRFEPPPAEILLADQVGEARLRQTVRDLVRLGPRMGGTPSGNRAAAYLAAAFSDLGLQPQTIDDPPALAHWEDAWSVELVAGASRDRGRPGASGTTGALGDRRGRGSGGPGDGGGGIPAGITSGNVLASAYPYGFSPSVGPAEAPLVVVTGGFAAAAADAATRRSWRGKVVYVPGDVLAAYRGIAADADRPLAILTSSPNDGKRYLDSSRLASLPPSGAGGAPAIPVFAVSYQDGRKLAAAAGATVRVSLRSSVRRGRPRTVMATLGGRDPDHYYLVCAHGDSDSGGPGADDNASGEAAVLEVARALARLVRDGRLPAPRVSLRFAVWGAEYLSSAGYVEREGADLNRCLGVINLDEVGTGAERDAIYFESNEVPWNRALLRTFDRVGADYLGRPGFWPEYTTNPSQGGTDSYAFLPRRFHGELGSQIEIPATTVYTAAWDHLAVLRQTPGWESPGAPDPTQLAIDYSRYYHSSGDTPENTTDRKPQAMVRASRAIGIALLRLAWQPPSP